MAEKKNNNKALSLEKTLWQSADKLRKNRIIRNVSQNHLKKAPLRCDYNRK